MDHQNVAQSNGKKRKSVSRRIAPATHSHDEPSSDDSDVPIVSKRKLNNGSPQASKMNGRHARSASEKVPLRSKASRDSRGQDSPKAKGKSERSADISHTRPAKREPRVEASKSAKKTAAHDSQKRKANGESPSRSRKVKEEAEAEQDLDETYRWWENQAEGDSSVKWTTLEHNGIMFPPPYERLPGHVKMLYKKQPIVLAAEAEEVAGFFGAMLDSEVNMSNPKFVENFFDDFQTIITDSGGAKTQHGKPIEISAFEDCDFKPLYEHFQQKKLEKASLTTAEKKAAKAEKDSIEEPFSHCLWDGRKEKVGNFRVEPPGLFRGRGDHPKTGRVKKRVYPDQITINIGEEALVPSAPQGTHWKKVQHDNTVSWLAMWTENINGAFKYVMLAAKSSIKGQSDFKKFEKARELDKHIGRIRDDYYRDLLAEMTVDRQRATAMWLIDRLGLRAGNEKGEDEADTVGCCSLKLEHVTLQPGPNEKPEGGKVVFDFLGKDSIRFYNEYSVGQNETIPIQVYKNLKIFKKHPKDIGDQIFDRLTTTGLNDHLKKCMPGLSAKVFRTYNASKKMSELLKESSRFVGTVNEKFKGYNDANRDVAIFCNHKRTIGTGHAGQMEKLEDRIKGMKYQQWRLKQMMLSVDPKYKKLKIKTEPRYFDVDLSLDDAWIQLYQVGLVDTERQKITKRFERDNEKLRAEGEEPMGDPELQERLKAATELQQKFKTERRTHKVEPEPSNTSIDKLTAKVEAIEVRIANTLLQAEDKESNKEVALNTSKINYIDPRLTVVFCKRYGVPIEKPFSKTLREKFAWAIGSVDADWEF